MAWQAEQVGNTVFRQAWSPTKPHRAVIDRRYPLAAIADAYRYVETGQKVGVVVIDVVMWDDFVANSRFPVSTGSSGP